LYAVAAGILGSVLPAPAVAASGTPAGLVLSVEGWQLQFDAATSTLECRHVATGVTLKGRLSFAARRDGRSVPWTVQPARDFAQHRLALVDPRNDAQGYVSVSGEAGRLLISALQRPPQNYAGELRYEAETAFGPRAFACRTRVPAGGRVVQMASGAADSQLNDSIFDPERDLVLRFAGRAVALATRPGPVPVFSARVTASPEQTGGAAIGLEVISDYYRARYVPKYRLIDRSRCPRPPTGWMSWNVYFDTAGERENLDEARVGARLLKPFGLEIWSIESWQENSPRLPVSDFYNLTLEASRTKFPHGMKWLADEIRGLGFRPGIWTVPFGTGDQAYYEAHRGMFLHHPDGTPMRNWSGRFVLDPSQPEVRRQMEESHRTMSAEWGYEFFKIDGMSGRDPGYSAHFFERPEVRAAFRNPGEDAYPLCIEALRNGIGPDRIFLACQGHYTGPEVAAADAARMGADIVHPNEPPHWENYLSQAQLTLNQLFTNNIVWCTDPDTLLVGDAAPLASARLAATVVGLPGQLTFFGDKLAQLRPERVRLLQQVLPVCDVHPLDLVPIFELRPVWDLKIRRPFASWDVVAVFNWSERKRDVRVTFAELGLPSDGDYLVHDFWGRSFLGARRGALDVVLEPRSSALLSLHERLGRPQLVSTDRHVSQGGVEWTSSAWDEARGELTSGFELVAGDPLTAFFHVPAGYAFVRALADGAEVTARVSGTLPILTVRLQRPTSGEGRLALRFRKTGAPHATPRESRGAKPPGLASPRAGR
jgi:hypothetical protein